MENVIRVGRMAGQVSGRADGGDPREGKEPTIALRMDFGV
jgi:hypothetical protein